MFICFLFCLVSFSISFLYSKYDYVTRLLKTIQYLLLPPVYLSTMFGDQCVSWVWCNISKSLLVKDPVLLYQCLLLHFQTLSPRYYETTIDLQLTILYSEISRGLESEGPILFLPLLIYKLGCKVFFLTLPFLISLMEKFYLPCSQCPVPIPVVLFF